MSIRNKVTHHQRRKILLGGEHIRLPLCDNHTNLCHYAMLLSHDCVAMKSECWFDTWSVYGSSVIAFYYGARRIVFFVLRWNVKTSPRWAKREYDLWYAADRKASGSESKQEGIEIPLKPYFYYFRFPSSFLFSIFFVSFDFSSVMKLEVGFVFCHYGWFIAGCRGFEEEVKGS